MIRQSKTFFLPYFSSSSLSNSFQCNIFYVANKVRLMKNFLIRCKTQSKLSIEIYFYQGVKEYAILQSVNLSVLASLIKKIHIKVRKLQGIFIAETGMSRF